MAVLSLTDAFIDSYSLRVREITASRTRRRRPADKMPFLRPDYGGAGANANKGAERTANLVAAYHDRHYADSGMVCTKDLIYLP